MIDIYRELVNTGKARIWSLNVDDVCEEIEILLKGNVVELIKKQIKDQGCEGDSFESLELMQPHLYEWITLFELNEEDLK